jgi:hypothetical protein
METIKKGKSFDCVKMKNDIQAKIYAETKNMSTNELLEYFNGSVVLRQQRHVRRHLSSRVLV